MSQANQSTTPTSVHPMSAHRTLKTQAESFLTTIQKTPTEFAYCQAWATRSAEEFAACFEPQTGTYRSFLTSLVPANSSSNNKSSNNNEMSVDNQRRNKSCAAATLRAHSRAGTSEKCCKASMTSTLSGVLLLLCLSRTLSEFPRFFDQLRRDIREFQIHFHSVAHSSQTTVLEYTLRGLWSGRLPSMVVGVYDKPIALRCMDILYWDETRRLIQRVDVRMDRYDFLVQIGMAQAKL